MGAEVIHQPEKLSDLLAGEKIAYVIGGAQIYEQFLPLLDELIVTHVHKRHRGDTFFPPYESLFPRSELILEHPDFTVKRWSK